MATGLTIKQHAFALAYIELGMNGVQAVYKAGYRVKNYATAGVIAHENLRKPKIRQFIGQLLKERAMSAEEVLYRLTRQAEGVDTTEFMSLEEVYGIDKDGEAYLSGYALKIDLDEINRRGLGNLIKKIGQNVAGFITVEWYDAKSALDSLAKYHELFKEDKPSIEINIFNLDDWKRERQSRLERVAHLEPSSNGRETAK